MTRFFAALTVLLVHTGAAYAQQVPAELAPLDQESGTAPGWGPVVDPGPAAPAGPSPAAGPPAPAVPPAPPAVAPAKAAAPPSPSGPAEYPPGYGPPPGYFPPPDETSREGYGPPPSYGPPPGYGPPPYGPPPYGPSPYGGPSAYGPPPYFPYRHRAPMRLRGVTDRPFTIGGGIGFGGLDLNERGASNGQSGMAFTARLGLGLRPGLILMWDVEGAVANRGNATVSQTANLAALQIFIGDRLFLKGGFGLAQVYQDSANYTGWAPAFMGGLGVEVLQQWNWSLDIETTLTGARYTVANTDETWLNWSLVNFAINFY